MGIVSEFGTRGELQYLGLCSATGISDVPAQHVAVFWSSKCGEGEFFFLNRKGLHTNIKGSDPSCVGIYTHALGDLNFAELNGQSFGLPQLSAQNAKIFIYPSKIGGSEPAGSKPAP